MKPLVKRLLQTTRMSEKEIHEYLGGSEAETKSYLSLLQREGLIEQKGSAWRLRRI